MNKKLIALFIAICIALALSSCKNNDDGGVTYVPVVMPKTVEKVVVILYPPNALGDASYYDNISYGVHSSAIKNKLYTSLDIVPSDWNEAEQYIETVLKLQSADSDVLLLFADAAYIPLLNKLEKSTLEKQQILVMEAREIENQAISTVFMPQYGMSYLAGIAAKSLSAYFASQVKIRSLCFLANTENHILYDWMAGYSEGFGESYGKVYDLSDITNAGTEANEAVKTASFLILRLSSGDNKLGIDSVSGFNNSNTVYGAMSVLQSSDYPFHLYIPLCGSGIQGVLRYSREAHDKNFLISGINSDMSFYGRYVPFSTVKHVDKVIEKCITQWVNEKKIPHYQEFGLKDGYTELVIDKNFSKAVDGLKTAVEAAKETAVTKEREYEDKQKA